MNVLVKQTNETESAYEIAKGLPHFFNEDGLKQMKEDFVSDRLIGAYIEGKMVGFITYKELNPEAVEISWLAVSPDYQRNGIGSKLFSESIKQIGDGYKVCEVKTLSEIDPDEGYKKTRAFYRKIGFIPLETIHPYPGWGEENPCQIFVKFLGIP